MHVKECSSWFVEIIIVTLPAPVDTYPYLHRKDQFHTIINSVCDRINTPVHAEPFTI